MLRWNAKEWQAGNRFMAWVTRVQQRALGAFLQRPAPWLAAVVGLFVGSLLLFGRLGGEFIPDLPEGDFAVETKLLPGSNLETSTEAVRQASGLL
ncbi:MAG: efflux RND transporter permease subunit, partial [Bacteroidota bacterium]